MIGDFGTLLYAARTWADPVPSRASVKLMAEKVVPPSLP